MDTKSGTRTTHIKRATFHDNFFFEIFFFRFWLGGAAPRPSGFWLGGQSYPTPAGTPVDGLAVGLPPPRPPAFFVFPSDDTGTADDTGAADAVGSKYFAKQVYGAPITSSVRLPVPYQYIITVPSAWHIYTSIFDFNFR